MALIFKAVTKYAVKYKDDKGEIIDTYASGQTREELKIKMIARGYTVISFGEDESNS